MRIDILTLFPEMFAPLQTSILGRAQQKGAFVLNIHNIRDFTADKHQKCDDYPFGGGDGMVMSVQPVHAAAEHADPGHRALRIVMSPQGQVLDQRKVKELSECKHLVLLCGHYEGIDQRATDIFFDEELSIGDYVLTGGELAAMVVCDSVCRYLPGTLHSDTSVVDESFSHGLLEYPQYTRPADYLGHKVPDVLLSGNHAEILKWRRQQSEEATRQKRPDLWGKYKGQS